MSAITAPTESRGLARLLPSRQTVPLLVTFVVCVVLFLAASFRYEHFLNAQLFSNLIAGSGFLAIAAIGMTFVILAGGIDLSVGTAIGCTSVFVALQVQVGYYPVPILAHWHGIPVPWMVLHQSPWHPALAIAVALLLGTVVGLVQGFLIHKFELQPFLVTLGGLFFYRGLGLILSNAAISIDTGVDDPVSGKYVDTAFGKLTNFEWNLSDTLSIKLIVIVFAVLFIAAVFFAAKTRTGRTVYALGGSEQSSLLMGLPVGRIKIGVYALCGFCAALAGVMSAIDSGSGDPLRGIGLELDAIAAVVVGGTLLSGGVGGPLGTLVGVLIFALITEVITRGNPFTTTQGAISSWWARIFVGLLLLAFILLQSFLKPKESHA